MDGRSRQAIRRLFVEISLQLGRHLALAPALQRSLQFLQMNALEFEQEISAALSDNPLLERDDEPHAGASEADAESTHADPPESAATDPRQETVADGTEADVEHGAEPEADAFDAAMSDGPASLDIDPESMAPDQSISADWISNIGSSGGSDVGAADLAHQTTSLRDHLWEQVRALSASDLHRACCALVVDSLDDDGYLRDDDDELLATARRLGLADAAPEDMATAVQTVRKMDPAGVGARTLRECLLLQLDALPANTPAIDIARRIVDQCLGPLAQRDFRQISATLGLPIEELSEATRLIRSLDPKPGEVYGTERIDYAVPEIIVRKAGKRWVAMLHPSATPRIRLHAEYAAIAGQKDRPNQALHGKLQEARWLLRSIDQRAQTIERTAQAIVERQQKFFDYGDIALQSMKLADIAEDLGIHESTVSRVVSSKYLQCPRGLIPMKRFFTSHVETAAGNACSATAVKAMIRQLIENESPEAPVSDHRLTRMLDQRGIRIARRTVTKYRDAIGIDSVEMRRHVNRPRHAATPAPGARSSA